MGFIYLITNNVNNKKYVGQTIGSIQERWNQHLRATRDKGSRHLYDAIKKYGYQSFSIQKIEEVPNEQLNERECFWISYYDSFKNGYNMTSGGEGGYYYSSDEEIWAAWIKGLSINQIVKECHTDSRRVVRILDEHQVSTEEREEHARISKFTKEEVKQLWEQGLCLTPLARKLHSSNSIIKKYLLALCYTEEEINMRGRKKKGENMRILYNKNREMAI